MYKTALRQAMGSAGIQPALGGLEYGEEIADSVDTAIASRNDDSFGAFRDDLRHALVELRTIIQQRP